MSLRRSLAWTTLSQLSFFVLQFGGSVVLARLLTPAQMGVYAVAAAMVGVLGTIQAFGLVGFVVREHDLTPELTRTVFTINFALAALLSAAIFGLSTIGGHFFRDPGVTKVLHVLSVTPLLGAIEFLPAANIERQGKFKIISIIGIIKTIVITVVTVVLAFSGYNYMSIAYAQLVGFFVSCVAYVVVGKEYIIFKFGLAKWKHITSYGVQMLAISGVNSLTTRASEVMLGRIVGLPGLGLYTRSNNLNRLLWDNVHLIIGRVVFVDFANQKREGLSLREPYLRTVEIVTAVLWPAFAGLGILAAPFIQNVYGPNWTAAAAPLGLLSIAAIVQVSITMTWEIFVVSGETKAQARFEFIRSAVGLVFFGIGCTISLAAAAGARIADAVFSMILYRPHLERMTDTSLKDFLPIYARSAMLTVGAVAPAAILMIRFMNSPTTPLLGVIGSIILGIIIWALGLAGLRHPLFKEVSRLFIDKSLR